MTRLHVTAVIAPPPHLLKVGARTEQLSRSCERSGLGGVVAELTGAAERTGVFDSGGCLTLLIQRQPERPAEQGPG